MGFINESSQKQTDRNNPSVGSWKVSSHLLEEIMKNIWGRRSGWEKIMKMFSVFQSYKSPSIAGGEREWRDLRYGYEIGLEWRGEKQQDTG